MIDIAASMRAQELQRRTARQRELLARLHNEIKLADEPLTSIDQAAHEFAVDLLQRQVLKREKELSPGYWRRLWAALLNK